MQPNIPDRVSDAGPEPQALDWRDLLWVAEEHISAAFRMEVDIRFDSNEKRNRNRLAALKAARIAIEQAEELLCR